jgi:hypothetical protein
MINATTAGGVSINSETTAQTPAKVVTNGDILFTIVGDIQIISLVSECFTTGTPAASTFQYQAVPTTGAAATFTGATGSLATAVAGSSVIVADGQTTVPSFNVSGANNNNTYPIGIFCPSGTINIVVGTGPTTGTWKHYLRYYPLETNAYAY